MLVAMAAKRFRFTEFPALESSQTAQLIRCLRRKAIHLLIEFLSGKSAGLFKGRINSSFISEVSELNHWD